MIINKAKARGRNHRQASGSLVFSKGSGRRQHKKSDIGPTPTGGAIGVLGYVDQVAEKNPWLIPVFLY